MTATPRFVAGSVIGDAEALDCDVASMDNEAKYGPVFHRLPFAEAIDRGLLTDYQVVVVGVDDVECREMADKARWVESDGIGIKNARPLAAQIGVAKAMSRHDMRRAISFHSRIDGARRFARSLPEVISWMPDDQRPTGQVWANYVSGAMTASQRRVRIQGTRHHRPGSSRTAVQRALPDRGRGRAHAGRRGLHRPETFRGRHRAGRRSCHQARPGQDRRYHRHPSLHEHQRGPRSHPGRLAVQDGLGRGPGAAHARRGTGRTARLTEAGTGPARRRSAASSPEKIHLDLPVHIGADFARAFTTRLVDSVTAPWEEWFGAVLQFLADNGHACVPVDYEVDGRKIGRWCVNQRARAERLSGDRWSRLDALPGWFWNVNESKWEEDSGPS